MSVTLKQAELVVAKVKRLVLRRGGDNGIRGLSRALKVVEDDSSATLSKSDFALGLKEFGVELTAQDLDVLFKYFDRNGDATIVPTEFLTALRGGLSPRRRALVHRAFAVFEKDSDGCASVSDIRARFDASRHPKVLRGEASEAEVQRQLLESFDKTTNPDGAVSKQEFEQYYAGVSASVDDDDVFEALMRGCWRLPGCSQEQTIALALTQTTKTLKCHQDVATQEDLLRKANSAAAFADVMAAHRAHLLKAPMGFRGVGRLLRQQDVAQTGFLPTDVFVECLSKNRLYIDESLLVHLDSNQDGRSCDYVLYLEHVLGELPPSRRLMLERLWKSFPTDKQGRTELDWIHGRYHAPDGEALSQFLSAWDKRLVPDGKVRYVELEEWFAPLSAHVSSDLAFEKALHAQWKL